MSARTRKDWLMMGALGCALVGTAHAEYTLAVAAHFNEYVALSVPGALDLYVLRALQQRRDVLVAVLTMVAANVTAHLLAADVLQEHWAITSAAGALTPLILWRVYALKYAAGAVSAPVLEDERATECTCTRWRRVLARFGRAKCTCTSPVSVLGCPQGHDECAYSDGECVAGTPSAPVPGPLSTHAPACVCEECNQVFGGMLTQFKDGSSAPALTWVPGYHLDGCDGMHPGEDPRLCEDQASALHSTAPEYVPASWMDDEYPETHPSAPALDEYAITCVAHSLPECGECTSKYGSPEASTRTHLSALPDLPPEYLPSAVHSESPLKGSDLPFVPGAQRYVDDVVNPSIRGLMKALSVGQDRAGRLLTHLGVIL